jgi:hypothetical protein
MALWSLKNLVVLERILLIVVFMDAVQKLPNQGDQSITGMLRGAVIIKINII